MKIHIISAALPPKLNGIGDYTAQFASAITPSANVTILTSQQPVMNAITGVTIKPIFEVAHLRSVNAIVDVVCKDRPDWLVLQFEQFFYGPRWGFNPYLPLAIRKIKHQCPDIRFALMAHERFVSFETWQTTIMASWQRWQYASLVHSADVVFFSIEAWAKMLQSRQPQKRVYHLPVGSCISRISISREAARQSLHIPESTFVVGLFGSPATNSKMMCLVQEAMQSVRRDTLLQYVGPRGTMVRAAMKNIPIIAEGPLPAEEVSQRFAAMDAYLVPIDEGVTTRRSTLMIGLLHGIATVTTCSSLTDMILQQANEKALLLSPVEHPDKFCYNLARIASDQDLRMRLQSGAQALYEAEFAWPRIASTFLAALDTPC